MSTGCCPKFKRVASISDENFLKEQILTWFAPALVCFNSPFSSVIKAFSPGSMASASAVITLLLRPWGTLSSYITKKWNIVESSAKTIGLIPMSAALNTAFIPALVIHSLKYSCFLFLGPSLPCPLLDCQQLVFPD